MIKFKLCSDMQEKVRSQKVQDEEPRGAAAKKMHKGFFAPERGLSRGTKPAKNGRP